MTNICGVRWIVLVLQICNENLTVLFVNNVSSILNIIHDYSF